MVNFIVYNKVFFLESELYERDLFSNQVTHLL